MTTLDIQPLMSNLARFALMRATRPVCPHPVSATDQIDHLYAVRDWARRHDHTRCLCMDQGWCPACSLRQCDCCDATLIDEQPCTRCLDACEEVLAEERDVRRCERKGAWS